MEHARLRDLDKEICILNDKNKLRTTRMPISKKKTKQLNKSTEGCVS